MEETALTIPRWLTKDEAASILKISPRRVLEYVQAGALASQTIRDPRTNQMTKQIDAADVARLREERENPQPQPSQAMQLVGTTGGAVVRKPAGRPSSQTVARQYAADAKGAGGAESRAIARRYTVDARSAGHAESQSFANWPVPLYLTLEQAMRFTGLSEAELRRCAKGAPRGPRRALVYRRAELEAL